MTARRVLLGDEDAGAYRAFRDSLFRQWAPLGEVECFLVHRLAGIAWRLLRCPGIEAELLETLREPNAAAGGLARAFLRNVHADSGVMVRLARYETTLERAFYRALRTLWLLQMPRRAAANGGAERALDAPPAPEPADRIAAAESFAGWLEEPLRAVALPVAGWLGQPLRAAALEDWEDAPEQGEQIGERAVLSAGTRAAGDRLSEPRGHAPSPFPAAAESTFPPHSGQMEPKADILRNKPPAQARRVSEGASSIIAVQGWAGDPAGQD
jgi:hypothetical protein